MPEKPKSLADEIMALALAWSRAGWAWQNAAFLPEAPSLGVKYGTTESALRSRLTAIESELNDLRKDAQSWRTRIQMQSEALASQPPSTLATNALEGQPVWYDMREITTNIHPATGYAMRQCRGHWHVTYCGEVLATDPAEMTWEQASAERERLEKENDDLATHPRSNEEMLRSLRPPRVESHNQLVNQLSTGNELIVTGLPCTCHESDFTRCFKCNPPSPATPPQEESEHPSGLPCSNVIEQGDEDGG